MGGVGRGTNIPVRGRSPPSSQKVIRRSQKVLEVQKVSCRSGKLIMVKDGARWSLKALRRLGKVSNEIFKK